MVTTSNRKIPPAFYPVRGALLSLGFLCFFVGFRWITGQNFPALAGVVSVLLLAAGLITQWTTRRLVVILGFAAFCVAVGMFAVLHVGLDVLSMMQGPSTNNALSFVVLTLNVAALLTGCALRLGERTDEANFLRSMGQLNRHTGDFDPRFPAVDIGQQRRAEQIARLLSFLAPLLTGLGIGFSRNLPMAGALGVITGCVVGLAGLYAFLLGRQCGLLYLMVRWEKRTGKFLNLVGR